MSEPEWMKTARAKGLVAEGKKANLFAGAGDQNDAPILQDLLLPWPPTANHYWIHLVLRTKTGKNRVAMVLGAEGKAFREAARAVVHKDRLVTMKGPLRFEAIFCPPDQRNRDLDNLLKPTIDALKRDEKEGFPGLYFDDVQIREISVAFGTLERRGTVLVSVRQLD